MRRNYTHDDALTVGRVAERLQMPELTTLRFLTTGELRGHRDHAGWRITEQGLQAFLEARANVSSAKWRHWLRRGLPIPPELTVEPKPHLVPVKDGTAKIVAMPGRGLNDIDLRVIEFACRFLGWDLDTSETPEGETFAVLGSSELEDVVFILTRTAQAYVLTEFPAQSDEPRIYAKGSLQAVFEILPKARAYHCSA